MFILTIKFEHNINNAPNKSSRITRRVLYILVIMLATVFMTIFGRFLGELLGVNVDVRVRELQLKEVMIYLSVFFVTLISVFYLALRLCQKIIIKLKV